MIYRHCCVFIAIFSVMLFAEAKPARRTEQLFRVYPVNKEQYEKVLRLTSPSPATPSQPRHISGISSSWHRLLNMAGLERKATEEKKESYPLCVIKTSDIEDVLGTSEEQLRHADSEDNSEEYAENDREKPIVNCIVMLKSDAKQKNEDKEKRPPYPRYDYPLYWPYDHQPSPPNEYYAIPDTDDKAKLADHAQKSKKITKTPKKAISQKRSGYSPFYYPELYNSPIQHPQLLNIVGLPSPYNYQMGDWNSYAAFALAQQPNIIGEPSVYSSASSYAYPTQFGQSGAYMQKLSYANPYGSLNLHIGNEDDDYYDELNSESTDSRYTSADTDEADY